MGYSFGGYYSGRIAAFEKRFAAGISLSALHWDLAAWQTRIKEKNQSDPKAVAQSNFQFQWVVNAPTVDDAIEVARKFSLKDVAKNITCPYLVTHGGNDRVVPVENAPKLFEAIGVEEQDAEDLHRRGGRRRARPCRQPPGRHRLRGGLAGGEHVAVGRGSRGRRSNCRYLPLMPVRQCRWIMHHGGGRRPRPQNPGSYATTRHANAVATGDGLDNKGDGNER